MVALSIVGLNWCQHAGWTLALYDARGKRRLQITLRLDEALLLGQELARKPTDRSGLYMLVGTLLRNQPQPASIKLALAESSRASVALVVGTDEERIGCPTSPADGVALAVRAGLPILAEEELLAAFGVPVQDDSPGSEEQAFEPSEIPLAFRQALNELPDDAA
jgi:bifunctional DNase/RNase